MNTANKLTLSRIVLAFFFMGFLAGEGVLSKVIALALFCLASLTDLIDGWVARRRNEITDLGKLLDPVADKILVLAAFLSFVEMNLVAAWMVVIIIVRELFITGLRVFAVRRGKVLEAQTSGKHKTVSQIVTIFFILIVLIAREIGLARGVWSAHIESIARHSILALMLITVGLTLSSGFSYVWSNRTIIRSL